VELLGTPIGLDGKAPAEDPAAPVPFARADVEEAARRLADLLREERADVLTSYDAAGGYGHPDHVQVHRVAQRAASWPEPRCLLEATVDRTLLRRAVRLVAKVYQLPPEFDVSTFDRAYTERSQITHRVDVRHYTDRKRDSMRAHAARPRDSGDRTWQRCCGCPGRCTRVLGREWFVERGRTPGAAMLDESSLGAGASGAVTEPARGWWLRVARWCGRSPRRRWPGPAAVRPAQPDGAEWKDISGCWAG